MRIIKTILLILVSIVALLLITGLFLKKEYSVEKEITINKPKQEVYDYIKLLKNQDEFSRWAQMEPTMKKSYRGTDGTVGFVSAWEGKEVGTGEQEIIKMDEGNRIDYQLRFIKPWKSESDAYLTTESTAENNTKVKWGFHGKMNYPMNVMQLFMNMEKMIGEDLQTGLNNLKAIMEK